MQIVTTNSEAEALLLEAQLIKRYRPPYNVLLRDDKSFPFILLREDHDFPRVQLHRGARRHKGQYFGPFASAGSVRETLNALQKLFLLRSCSDSFFANRTRPAAFPDPRCSAPCVGRVRRCRYGELVQDRRISSWPLTKSQQKLGNLMRRRPRRWISSSPHFTATGLRALTFIQGSQAIHAERLGDADLFALACKGGTMCIQAFFIRGGHAWGHRSFFPAHTAEVPEEEVLASFLGQFYEEMPPPRLILVDRPLAEAALLEEAFTARVGRRVTIRAPQRGEQAQIDPPGPAKPNEELDRRLAETSTLARNCARSPKLFECPSRRADRDLRQQPCDGHNAVGAMVVAGPKACPRPIANSTSSGPIPLRATISR